MALFKTEWLRISKVAWTAAGLHCVLLVFLVNFGLIFSTTIGFKISLVSLYGFVGLLFAVLQIKLYKEESQWIFLLNRPISEKQVFTTLLLAAVMFLAISIVLPFAVITWVLDRYSAQLVDWRHYAQLWYLFMVSLSCYLAGCFLTLSRSKWFAMVLILPVLTVMNLNQGGQVLGLQLLVVILLLLMVLVVFKINLHRQLSGKGLGVIMALVMQWCVFMAVSSVVDVVQLSQIEIEYLTRENHKPEAGNFPQKFRPTTYLDSKEKVLSGLSALDPPTLKKYQQQLSLHEAFRIRKRVWFHPTEQQIQLMDERALVLSDEEGNLWTFSHDEMLFIGHNNKSLAFLGYLGADKSSLLISDFSHKERFNAVPWIAGQQLIVRNELYRLNPETQRLEKVFSAQPDEYLLNVLQQQGGINTIITNQNLYIFDAIETQKKQFPLTAVVSMPLPGDYNNLWDIHVVETKAGFLLSFLYGKDPRKDVYQAEQLTYEFNLEGQVQLLAKRPLQHDEGEILRFVDYLISPLWKVVTDRLPPLPGRDRYLAERPQVLALPLHVLLTLIGLAALYFGLSYHWARQRHLSNKQKWIWSLTNVITGLPGLISFLLIHEKQDSLKLATSEGRLKPHSQPMEVKHV